MKWLRYQMQLLTEILCIEQWKKIVESEKERLNYKDGISYQRRKNEVK